LHTHLSSSQIWSTRFGFISLGTLTMLRLRQPYNLYCVGADVKPCSINQSINQCLFVCFVFPPDDWITEIVRHRFWWIL